MEVRKVFIDCGVWEGNSILAFKKYFSDFEIYGFECHPILRPMLKKLSAQEGFRLINKAVWVEDTTLKFYLGVNNLTQSSSLYSNKKRFINRKKAVEVEAIDFSKWIKDNFSKDDYIIVKMNIEGAEYDVLPKMVVDGTLKYINKLYIAWHNNKLKKFDQDKHNGLVPVVKEITEVCNWNYEEKDEMKGRNPF